MKLMTSNQIETLRKAKTTVPIWLLTTIFVTLVVGVVTGLLLRNVLSLHQVALTGRHPITRDRNG
jgi:hypothetical protein